MKHLDPSQRGRMVRKKTGTYQEFPAPRGAAFQEKKKEIDPEEAAKLEATKALGGLVPERSPLLDQLVRQIGPLKK